MATILIVDDDPGVTEIFGRMLRLEGYNVRTAVDPEQGLREADEHHPDAILLDLRMPFIDGLLFLRRLRGRQEHQNTPVAIVTGAYFMDDAENSELEALGAEVVFKPLWIEDVVKVVRSLLKTP